MANTTSTSRFSSSSAHKTLPGTSSSCSSQSITATHDFVVNDFSLLDGMGLGRCVTSSTFAVGNTEWDISLNPDGFMVQTDRHVSVSLFLRRGPNNTRAKFSCSLLLLDEDDAKVLKECKQHTFPAPSYWWNWPEFVLKSELQEMLKGCSSDSFTIRCVLTVLTTRTVTAETIVVPASDLHQDLARMLADGDGADVKISVGDRSFLAHRYVLAARSKVFKAQLKESNTAECLIKIEDMEPSAFEMLLHFIYTDSLPAESFGAEGDRFVATMQLLVAADRYGLFRLGLMCEEKLRGWIDVHSVATILRLADQHHCEQLKEACMRFISWPHVLRQVMETEEFDDIFTNCPTIIWEILERIAVAGSRIL